jgi:hypothetical protein
MRNSPLKGLLKKKDKSPLEINPMYDQTFYDPKTQLELSKRGVHVGKWNNDKKGAAGSITKRAMGYIKKNKQL